MKQRDIIDLYAPPIPLGTRIGDCVLIEWLSDINKFKCRFDNWPFIRYRSLKEIGK